MQWTLEAKAPVRRVPARSIPSSPPTAPVTETMAPAAHGVGYDWIVATNPKSDPIEDEGVRILDENSALRARLREFRRKLKDGEDLEVHEHDEARRIVGLGPLGVSDPSAD